MTPAPPAVVKAGLIALAIVAAVAPLPAPRIDEVYSRSAYLAWQRVMTGASNLTGLAVLDVLMVLAAIAVVVWVIVRVRAARRSGWGRTVLRAAADVACGAACVYLVFLAAWGLNYRRSSLRVTLDFDETRVTPAALATLANVAVDQINRLHPLAHGTAWASLPATPEGLEGPFDQAQRDLGQPRAVVAGRPKTSVLTWYFRRASIDGMTNPFALEVIVNPDVLPFERPMVLAHEWAHLAGFADEAEAGFVAWITCLRGSDQARYSAWLSLLLHLGADVAPEAYRAAVDRLQPGPKADIQAIVARVRRGVPMMRAASRRVYDGYLRANRVEAGLRSYDRVVTLVVGTRFEPEYRPVLRRAPR